MEIICTNQIVKCFIFKDGATAYTPKQAKLSSHEPPIAKIKKNSDAAELVLGQLDQLIRTSENPAFVCRLRQYRENELRFKEMQQNFLNAFEATHQECR